MKIAFLKFESTVGFQNTVSKGLNKKLLIVVYK